MTNDTKIFLGASIGTLLTTAKYVWEGDGPGIGRGTRRTAEAAGVEIDDPEWWTVEAADDVGAGPNAEPGPLTLEVDAWIGAVRRRPAGSPPPTARPDVGALRHRRCREHRCVGRPRHRGRNRRRP